ncbi:MAG: carboxypeptidase-like regulatory domain-containing protein [Pyrinomonadaceae bacterium]
MNEDDSLFREHMKTLPIFLLILGLVSVATAQVDKHIIVTGTIYDQKGAVIPNTTITARNESGEKFETVTNGEGVYKLTLTFNRYGSKKALETATYEIAAERPNTGFKKTVLKDFKVVPTYTGSMQLDLVLEALDPEPCGYAGADCLTTEPIDVKKMLVPSFKVLPQIRHQETGKEKTRYCMTVSDEVGAIIPKATVRFSPTKQSRSRTKYEFVTDAEGSFDSEVVDGIYDISIKAGSYKKVVLKNQLLPYDPQGCITIKLKSTVPAHQIT